MLLEQVPVNTLLLLGDANVHVNFDLRLQRKLDVFLDSSEQERSHDPMELLDDLLVAVFFLGFADCLIIRVEIEPLVKVVRTRKHLRQKEVEESPKLVKVVLKRRASQEKALLAVELSKTF